MHELAVCQAVISEAAQVAAAHEAEAVTGITVTIGPLSGVVPELLERAFGIACAGTVAATATLSIEEIRIRVRCNGCGSEGEVEPGRLLCPACGAWRVTVLTGDEMVLKSVELSRAKVPA